MGGVGDQLHPHLSREPPFDLISFQPAVCFVLGYGKKKHSFSEGTQSGRFHPSCCRHTVVT